MTAVLDNLIAASPELVLAVGIMGLVLAGVFSGEKSAVRLCWITVLLLVVTAITLVGLNVPGRAFALGGMFILDQFAVVMKLLILIGSAATIVMSISYLRFIGIMRFEFPILVATATLGMMMMVSSANLISLYLGLELQSLSLYVLAAFYRDNARSTEAGLKYFVLGALASGMLLYGASLIYGFTGTTDFEMLSAAIPAQLADGGASLGLVFGLVFVLAGLAFKISAVPFHMWTPDVYEGAPTAVTAFFAGAPKVAAMALLLRVLFDPLPALEGEWQQIVIFISIASMLLGSVAAIAQTNIKRLMAYSSIGHVGYALVGVAAGTPEGVEAVVLYMAIYMTMTLGTFICILLMRRPEGMVENIDDLAGLIRTRPGLAIAIGTFMISLIGFPPFAGFWGKLFVFTAAVDAGLYTLAVIGVLTSVVAAFYYLRIVKVVFFDEPALEFERPDDRPVGWLLFITALVNSPASFAFVFWVMPAIERAGSALAG